MHLQDERLVLLTWWTLRVGEKNRFTQVSQFFCFIIYKSIFLFKKLPSVSSVGRAGTPFIEAVTSIHLHPPTKKLLNASFWFGL